jgi:hypothetical protein
LNIEFVLVLVVSVLLRGATPQYLHGFIGDPEVLQQKLPQAMGPFATETETFRQECAAVVALAKLHEFNAAS